MDTDGGGGGSGGVTGSGSTGVLTDELNGGITDSSSHDIIENVIAAIEIRENHFIKISPLQPPAIV